jgi:hypothetical protein
MREQDEFNNQKKQEYENLIEQEKSIQFNINELIKQKEKVINELHSISGEKIEAETARRL